MKHIGQLIKQRREAMGLTQAALSREMGGYPSPSLMSRIEDGSVDLTPNSAAKYADALTARTTGDWLENGAGEKVTKYRLWGVILRYVTAFEIE